MIFAKNIIQHIQSKPRRLLLTKFICCALILAGCSPAKSPDSSFEYAVQGLYSAEFSANGKHVIVGSVNHGASLWEFASNARIYNWNHKQGSYSHIIAAAFSPDHNYALTATPQTMVLWNASNGQGLNYWTAPSEILDISLLNNGNFALLGLIDHSAALFDVKNGGVRQVFYHSGRVTAVDSNPPPSNMLLTGSEDYSARLWDIRTGKTLQQWRHKDEVQLVKLSTDGKLAFTMAKYDKAAIWETDSGKLKGEIPLSSTAIARGKIFTAVTFSSDSKYLLTGSVNRQVKLWEIENMTLIKHWEMPKRDAIAPTSASVLALAFGPDNDYYAITSDGFAHTLR